MLLPVTESHSRLTDYGTGTNNLAEIRALLDGLGIAANMGFRDVLIQTDSELVLQWIKKSISMPIQLKNWWEKIVAILGTINSEAIHVYIEGNTAADYLSKVGIRLQASGACNGLLDRKYISMKIVPS